MAQEQLGFVIDLAILALNNFRVLNRLLESFEFYNFDLQRLIPVLNLCDSLRQSFVNGYYVAVLVFFLISFLVNS